MLEFYSSSEHKARKPHKCHLCRQEINIGEKYKRESGKWEGDFFDRCSHMHCARIISEYISDSQEQEYDTDWINNWLSDTYCCECKDKEDCLVDTLQCGKIVANFKEVAVNA